MNPAFVSAAEMLRAPTAAGLPPQRIKGTLCVWCGQEPSMDLGPRLSVIKGTLQRWHPRSCRPCARSEAARVHGIHRQTCPRCSHGEPCPDGRALYDLAVL